SPVSHYRTVLDGKGIFLSGFVLSRSGAGMKRDPGLRPVWMTEPLPPLRPSLYLENSVDSMIFYSPMAPDSPTLLGSAKTVCKPGASGASSRQPAQLPGPHEPGSVGKVGRHVGGCCKTGGPEGYTSNLCGH